jgi:hypothetical protein
MIRKRAPQRFVAWLALAAMWLVAFAPVISQTLLAAPATGIESGWCGAHPPPVTPDSPQPPVANPCGYCDLLGHNPVLLGVARVAALPPLATYSPPVRRQALHAPTQPPRIHAPRGPPLLANA